MFAPKCGGCGRAIVDNYISALNRHWHPECFACWVSVTDVLQKIYHNICCSRVLFWSLFLSSKFSFLSDSSFDWFYDHYETPFSILHSIYLKKKTKKHLKSMYILFTARSLMPVLYEFWKISFYYLTFEYFQSKKWQLLINSVFMLIFEAYRWRKT